MPKLFISYKHDKETLELIKKIVSKLKLKSLYYDVWFDNEQLKTGDSLTLEIEKGIIAADAIICFLTKKYIEAKSCRLEFFYSANKEKKCIYILLEGIDRNTPNGMNMYIFSDAIRFDAFKRKKENLDEYANVVFEEIIRSLNENFEEPVSFIKNFFQFSRNEDFYAREGLLEKIEMALQAKKRLCLFGYPGVGKTSCALEFSYQQMDKNNQRIIWIDAEDQTKISKFLTDFGKMIDKNETNIENIKKKFLNYINRENFLIIFDNLESIDDLTQTITIEMIKAPFLITTRLSKMANLDMLEIEPFKEAEAKDFLRKKLPQLDDENIDFIIKEYDDETEGLLPCNLSMMAGLLTEYKEKTVEEILKECKHGGYIVNIINKVKLQSIDSVKLLQITTLIDPDYISSKLLSKLTWESSYRDAIQKLSDFNLLTSVYPNTEYYGIKMHRIFIRDFKAYFESNNQFNLNFELINELMKALDKWIDYLKYDTSTHLKKFNNSILHAIEILKRNDTNQSLIASELFEKISSYYSNETQKFEVAIKYQEKGLGIKMKLIKGNDASLASSYMRTGEIYYKLGNDTNAIEYYKKSLEMREILYPGDHPDIAQTLNNLGSSYSNLGDQAKAIEYYEKSFKMSKRLYTGDQPDIANSLNNLGISYSKIGDQNNALEYKQKSLEMRKRLFTGDHPDIANSLNNLGTSYCNLGDETNALEYYEKSLEMRIRLYSDDHPDIANSLDNLGISYSKIGNETKALEYYEKSLEMRIRLYSGDHPDIAQSLNNLGISYERQGNYAMAIEYYKKALELKQRLYTGDHPDIGQSLHNLGVSYVKLKDKKKAAEFVKKGLEMRRRLYNDHHPDIIKSIETLEKIESKCIIN